MVHQVLVYVQPTVDQKHDRLNASTSFHLSPVALIWIVVGYISEMCP